MSGRATLRSAPGDEESTSERNESVCVCSCLFLFVCLCVCWCSINSLIDEYLVDLVYVIRRCVCVCVQQYLSYLKSGNRDRFITGGGYRLLAPANLGELVLGCIEANICRNKIK